jgi:thymidine kinase
MMDNCGYLEIILGPMFAGKTSKLIEIYNKNINDTVAINYLDDKRYDNNKLSTHDKIMIDCIQAEKLFDINQHPDIINKKIILINEGQFFPDLIEFVTDMVENKNKHVYICGLDADFQKNKFGNILDLIPICDTVRKLQGKCYDCHNKSIFSYRISSENDQIIIGSDNYKPICRNCYKKLNK